MFARIKTGFFPAVPVIVDAAGRIAVEATQAYIRWLMGHAVDGVAVWAHTGRGLYLSREDRKLVAELWASGIEDRILVCGVGSSSAQTEAELVRESVEMAVQAKEAGAHALLVYPPRILHTPRSVISYHQEIAQIGLPVIAFYLYEQAGGLPYSDCVIRGLYSIPEVVGMKVATLDSVMRFQEIAAVTRVIPEKGLITGEDRMLGYTFTAAARWLVWAQRKRICSSNWWTRRARTMLLYPLSADRRRSGEAIFCEPMEGYIAACSMS